MSIHAWQSSDNLLPIKQILTKATIYKKQNKDKNFKPYKGSSVDTTK